MKDFPWFKKYPAGTPHEIGDLKFGSLVELYETASKKYSDTVAYENLGGKLTYHQVDKLSRDFAAYLQKDLGLQKGERIAIQMPNLLQFPVAFMGALKAGLIVVNTNPLYTAREMEHQFKDAGISALVIVANFAHNLETIVDKIPAKHYIITEMGDLVGGFKGWLVNFVVKRIKKLVPIYHLPHYLFFKFTMKHGASLYIFIPNFVS